MMVIRMEAKNLKVKIMVVVMKVIKVMMVIVKVIKVEKEVMIRMIKEVKIKEKINQKKIL